MIVVDMSDACPIETTYLGALLSTFDGLLELRGEPSRDADGDLIGVLLAGSQDISHLVDPAWISEYGATVEDVIDLAADHVRLRQFSSVLSLVSPCLTRAFEG